MSREFMTQQLRFRACVTLAVRAFILHKLAPTTIFLLIRLFSAGNDHTMRKLRKNNKAYNWHQCQRLTTSKEVRIDLFFFQEVQNGLTSACGW